MTDVAADLCLFCIRPRGDTRVWCADNPGDGCTYGLAHEYPPRERSKQARPIDRNLCVRCGLHPKNPASTTNGCEHVYAGEAS